MIIYFGTVYTKTHMKEPLYFCYRIKSNIDTFMSKTSFWNDIAKIIFHVCKDDASFLDDFIKVMNPDNKMHPIHDTVVMWFVLQYAIKCLNRGYWINMGDHDLDEMHEKSDEYKRKKAHK